MDLLPQIQALIADDRLMPLGPGSPNLAVRDSLDTLQKELLAKAKHRDFALACMAGLWLYHDFLDESHAISQNLHTIEGSYWHALMHRREPDYWNAKYWFRRVGQHPIFDSLRDHVAKLGARTAWPAFRADKKWDAAGFVDLCESNAGPSASAHHLCQRVQQIEWQVLLDYCQQRAI